MIMTESRRPFLSQAALGLVATAVAAIAPARAADGTVVALASPGSQPAASASTTHRAVRADGVSIIVDTMPFEVKEVRGLPLKAVRARMGAEEISPGSGLGALSAIATATWGVGRTAAGAPVVAVTFGYKDIEMLIPKEISADACVEAMLVEHENGHARIYREQLPIMAENLRTRIGAAIDPSMSDADVNGVIRDNLNKEFDRVAALQRAFDSPKERDKNAEQCEGRAIRIAARAFTGRRSM